MKKKICKVILKIVAVLIAAVILFFAWLKFLAGENMQKDVSLFVSKSIPLLLAVDDQAALKEKYTVVKQNDPSIYEGSNKSVFYPFLSFSNDSVAIKKLCLVDFIGDTVYNSIEVQHVEQGNRVFYIVYMYRLDGNVDAYYSKGLTIDKEQTNAMMNNPNYYEVSFSKIRFEVAQHGLDLLLLAKDAKGRQINLTVKENRTKLDKEGIVAPIGDRSDEPDGFPVVFMKKFNFVESKNTTISINIDGKPCEPESLIPLFNMNKVFLSRYCESSNIKTISRTTSGNLEPVVVNSTDSISKTNNGTYEVVYNGKFPEIKSLAAYEGNSEMKLAFSPALPDVASLKDGVNLKGTFSLGVDEEKGLFGGDYAVKKSGNSVSFTMKPQDGWQPNPGELWMRSYVLNCKLTFSNGLCNIQSKWARTTSALDAMP